MLFWTSNNWIWWILQLSNLGCWYFNNIEFLTNVKFDVNNKNIRKLFEDKIFIGKINLTNEYYVFTFPNTEHIKLPISIKINGSFSYFKNLTTIEIPPKLEIIEEYAFSNSSIENIIIPFMKLCKVVKPNDKKLQIIDDNAFLGSSIENIYKYQTNQEFIHLKNQFSNIAR